MSNTKALLCLDIDGTLIDENEKIHPKDIDTLTNFPSSIQPILTTGRPLGSAKGVLHANNVFTDSPIPIPGVFMNGTTAYLPGEQLLLQCHFSTKIREEILELANLAKESTFAFFSLSRAHLINPTEFSLHIAQKHYLTFQNSRSEEIPERINKIMVIEENKAKLSRITNQTSGLEAEIAYSLPYLLEFTPKGVSKPTALQALLSALSLEDLPIYAVGDGQNDLSLFELAITSFSPSTAHNSIQEKADRILRREENGILTPILETIFQNL